MTIEFNCPNCDKLLRTKDDKAGSGANCPDCGEPITVPAAGSATDGEFDNYAETDGYQDDDYADDDGGFDEAFAPPRSRGSMKNCPMCGEQIKAAAIRCRYCGEALESSPSGGRRRSGRGGLRATKIDPGEVISTSLEIFKAEMGLCIGGTFVSLLCNVGVVLVGYAGFAMLMFGAMGVAGGMRNGVAGGVLGMFGLVALGVFVTLAQTYFQDGQKLFFLKIARGEEATIGDLFTGGHFVWRSLGLGFVFGLMVLTGMLLCIIPGYIVMLMFWPAQMLLVDRDMSIMESLSQAKEITEGNKLSIFVVMLAATGIVLLGELACGVGVIFAIPMVTLMMHVTYVMMIGQPTALD